MHQHAARARLGIIGGSGLYAMPALHVEDELAITTPFGEPSDRITVGTIGSTPVAFLPRHGRGHRISPSEVPARANIYALKSLGVEWVLSVSAVGSLREDYAPRDLVIPDQLFDRTKTRASTYFGDGVVAHVPMADPFCPHLRGRILNATGHLTGVTTHRAGTYVCIEGPQFSTKAESRIYRQLGCDIIGMTAIPEAKLAREAELCYAVIACVTDYDVWRAAEEDVSVEMVVANLAHNVANAQSIISAVAEALPNARDEDACGCGSALAGSVMSDLGMLNTVQREHFGLLLAKYLPQ